MNSKEKTLFTTRIIVAIGFNGVIWNILNDYNFEIVNKIVLQIVNFFFLGAGILMFLAAFYLMFDKEKMKLVRKVTWLDLQIYPYTLILFLTVLSCNLIVWLLV